MLVALGGLAVAAAGIRAQLKPRTFTPAQQARIRAWEVARRWQTTPKTALFPAVIGYRLTLGSSSQGRLSLSASRLAIAPQASCADAAGATVRLMALLRKEGCAALLRSTYADSSSSFVVTAGIAVLRSRAGALAAAHYLTRGQTVGEGGLSTQLVLRPYRVGGGPAALFEYPQRQISWVVAAGPYLVLATAGYADGRTRVDVKGDPYVERELISLIRGVASRVARPLRTPPPVPTCPGVPAC